MNELLRTAIATSSKLNAEALTQLQQDGFCIVPGPFPPRAMSALVNAYDRAMVEADPDERRVGRTTVRVNDLVNRGPEFDSIYLYPPLLDACWQILGRPFKLSVLHGRTLLPERPAQDWHVDYPLDMLGWTMVGFIFMIDEFRKENGATSFLRGSHLQAASHAPDGPVATACGGAGSMILYNGSAWHGHGSNTTRESRRSVQGVFIRREAPSSMDWPTRMRPDTLERLGPLARFLLAL